MHNGRHERKTKQMTFSEYRIAVIAALKDMHRNGSTAKLEKLANEYPEYEQRMENGEGRLTMADFADIA